MGVEHYIVCGQCKEYIDLHKSYSFAHVIKSFRPPVGIDCEEVGFLDSDLRGGYWESRGLWFLWHHRGHWGIEMYDDFNHCDEWYEMEPNLKEVFKHEDDLAIRKRVEKK